MEKIGIVVCLIDGFVGGLPFYSRHLDNSVVNKIAVQSAVLFSSIDIIKQKKLFENNSMQTTEIVVPLPLDSKSAFIWLLYRFNKEDNNNIGLTVSFTMDIEDQHKFYPIISKLRTICQDIGSEYMPTLNKMAGQNLLQHISLKDGIKSLIDEKLTDDKIQKIINSEETVSEEKAYGIIKQSPILSPIIKEKEKISDSFIVEFFEEVKNLPIIADLDQLLYLLLLNQPILILCDDKAKLTSWVNSVVFLSPMSSIKNAVFENESDIKENQLYDLQFIGLTEQLYKKYKKEFKNFNIVDLHKNRIEGSRKNFYYKKLADDLINLTNLNSQVGGDFYSKLVLRRYNFIRILGDHFKSQLDDQEVNQNTIKEALSRLDPEVTFLLGKMLELNNSSTYKILLSKLSLKARLFKRII